MVWESTFGMQAEDWANAVLQNDAGYLFGGALRDIGPIVQGGWLFQTDDAGSGLWSKSLYYYCSREDEKDDVLHDPCPEPNIESNNDTEAYDSYPLAAAHGGRRLHFRGQPRDEKTGQRGQPGVVRPWSLPPAS